MMRDEQRRDQDKPEARFEDALADLFGEAPDEAVSPAEAVSEPAQLEPQPVLAQPELPATPPSRPTTVPGSAPRAGPAGSPRSSGRSLRRIGCIAISAVFGALLLCVVILAVIGFIVGDPATPTPVV